MTHADEVWIVDDDRSIRWVLEKALQKAGIKAQCFSSAEGIVERLDQVQPDAVVTDIRMPGLDGLGLLKRLQERCPELPVIIMTAHSDLESAVSAFHGGAFEYLPKPFDVDEAVDRVSRACAQVQHLRGQRDPVTIFPEETPEIIGAAPAMQEVFRAIARLARSHITVLINGESGTGKELVAKALHRHSPRAAQPFIALNMAAIPRDLLESELFGHERGAFTGAQSRRAGRFEQADGGTCFLMKSAICPLNFRRASFGSSLMVNFSRWAPTRLLRSTSELLLPPIKILKRWFQRADFVRICFIV